jgi:integrase/recombinase XerD
MIYRDEYLESLRAKGFTEGTLLYRTIYLDKFFSYLQDFGFNRMDEITLKIIDEYKRYTLNYESKRTKKKLNLSTVYHRLETVRGYFNYLTSHKIIFINPAQNLELPELPKSLPKNILTEKDIKLLLNKPDLTVPIGLRDRAILEVLYSSGIRRQELVNLNVIDVDLKQGLLRVNKGKNKKDRVVPLGRTACYFLVRYIKGVRNKYLHPFKGFKEIKNKRDPALFISAFGGRLIPATLNSIVKKYMNEVYPGRTISCHAFRHACATHMLRGGANLRIIQQLLGHVSIETTQVYTRLSPIDLKEAHRKFHPRKSENGI